MCIKRSSYEKKTVIYVRTTVKQRKLVKSALETEADADAYDMNVENIADIIESTLFLALGEELRHTLSKHIKITAPFCSIYDMALEKFSGVDTLASGKIWRSKRTSFWETLVEDTRDGKEECEEYDLFGANDLKNTTKVMVK